MACGVWIVHVICSYDKHAMYYGGRRCHCQCVLWCLCVMCVCSCSHLSSLGRNCGLIFCSDCTKYRSTILAKSYPTPVRVCGRCFFALKQQGHDTEGGGSRGSMDAKMQLQATEMLAQVKRDRRACGICMYEYECDVMIMSVLAPAPTLTPVAAPMPCPCPHLCPCPRHPHAHISLSLSKTVNSAW